MLVCAELRTESRSPGKERDTETNLDYFGARYYSSGVGRWMSPDWSEAPQPVPYARLGNPQTLNLYAYVDNNPVSVADVDGHRPNIAGQPGGMGSQLQILRALEEADEAAQERQLEQSAAALSGPYVADLKSKEIAPLLDPNHKSSNSDVVGPNGECVDLTKKFSGMGKDDVGTYQWRRGPKVVDNKDIKPGTAIATFDDKGRFPSAHRWNSGIYLGRGVNGSIWILDQWPGHPPQPREVPLNNSKAPADNSGAYSVIYVKPR